MSGLHQKAFSRKTNPWSLMRPSLSTGSSKKNYWLRMTFALFLDKCPSLYFTGNPIKADRRVPFSNDDFNRSDRDNETVGDISFYKYNRTF